MANSDQRPATSDQPPVRGPQFLVWLRAVRAPFFTGTLVPAALGGVYANYAGVQLNWPLLALTLLGAVLAHAGLNMANDYFDHRSGNDYLTRATPVSGGSKVIQEGLLRPAQVLAAAIVCSGLAAAIGLYLNFLTGGRVILAVGLVGMAIAWLYTAPPVRLGARSGLGELVCLLGCGPVVVFGAYFVQARDLSWRALAAGVPTGLLMAVVLFINEFHDRDADARVGKRTLVVALGTGRSALVLAVALAVTFGLTVAFVAIGVYPALSLATLAALPLAAFAGLRALRHHGDSVRLLPANFAVIGLHLTYGIVLTASLVR
jgi:1,4-dihydroxy-2-naphthoate octaprenyltransferase